MRLRPPSGMKLVTLLLGGWTGLVFLFLYLPIVLLFVFSFNDSRLNIRWEGFTTKWFRVLWSDDPQLIESVPRQVRGNVPVLINALKNSLYVAGVTTFFSVILGTAGAWLLYRYRYPAPRVINTLIFVPMIIPEILMGISLLIFFATINFDLGFTTIIISHVTFCFPFVLVAVQARLAGVDPALEEAAMDLGATPWKAFIFVMVPYLLPAIISGALMSFTLSMDELIVTYFTKSPDSETMPVKIYGMARVGLNPTLNSISSLFILLTAVVVIAAEYIKRWNR